MTDIPADTGRRVPLAHDLADDSKVLARLAYRSAFRVLNDRDEAMDVAQSAMAALCVMREIPPSNSYAWVSTVSSNLAKNVIRKKTRERAAVQRAGEHEGPDGHCAEDIMLARLVVDELLQRLSPRERIAVELRFVEDLDRATIAELMDIGVEGVKTLLRRGVRKLRDSMDPLDSDEVED